MSAAGSGPAPSARPVVAPSGAVVRLAPRVVAGAVGLMSLVLVWVTWRLLVDTYAGQRLDQMAFDGATYGQGRLWSFAEPVLDVVSVTFVVAGLGAAMVVALIRRRWGLAVQVAVLVGGANVTTQLLKHQVFHRDNLIGGFTYENALPSGHTTVAASVAVALLIAVPRGARPLVALLGAAYTVAMGVSTLVAQWHRPSDAIAAALVVLAWGCVVLAFTPRSGLDPAPEHRGVVGPASWATGCLLWLGAAVAGAVAWWGAEQVLVSTDAARPTVTAYFAGASAVVATALLTFGVMLVLRQATACPRVPVPGTVGPPSGVAPRA
ncbi:phosphatase PAP2 family protein [Paraoerskovia sediminicola]|uniref:phosphatase PAP2 family protein n=1 Tax=Paraoerskovia sediminicola TaxID=1138587 RepID=UPI002574324D|nr:phosphatase PAP2 family protein [Paraoerskovia sediminicola]